MQGLANKLQCNYTRYADDITFSGGKEVNAQQLVWRVKKILQDESFTVHPDKIRIMRKGTQQEVTGVVVNRQLNVKRKDLREFRALLHNLGKNKSISQFPENISNTILGYVNFIHMVNPAKAAVFQKSIDKLYQDNILNKTTSAPPSKDSVKKENSPSTEKKPDKNEGDSSWWNVV